MKQITNLNERPAGQKRDGMEFWEYGRSEAPTVLIQPVDEQDLFAIEQEVQMIRDLADNEFCLIAAKVGNWNHDLSPWRAPAVFGNEEFGDGAAETLEEILMLCSCDDRPCCIGGYSLAGLFALWSAYQTDRFFGVAAASPSVWFPEFSDYMKGHRIKSKAVYLSLGDREEKARNPKLASVGSCIREGYETLQEQDISCILEWNKGNHFRDAGSRTAAAFAWVLRNV